MCEPMILLPWDADTSGMDPNTLVRRSCPPYVDLYHVHTVRVLEPCKPNAGVKGEQGFPHPSPERVAMETSGLNFDAWRERMKYEKKKARGGIR
jgi:hypothetical protein